MQLDGVRNVAQWMPNRSFKRGMRTKDFGRICEFPPCRAISVWLSRTYAKNIVRDARNSPTPPAVAGELTTTYRGFKLRSEF